MTEYEDSPVIQFRLGDGVDRRGFLGIGEIKELRRLTGMGPVKLSREMSDDPDPQHIEQVVRLAMIGAGADPSDALAVAEYYCRPPRPMMVPWTAAMAMLGAWWRGIPKSDRQPVSDDDTDVDVAAIEATAVRLGISLTDLHAMSVGEWIDLRNALTDDGAEKAPGADVLAGMMAAEGGGS